MSTQADLDFAPAPLRLCERAPELRIHADVIGFDLTVPALGKVAVLVNRECAVEVISTATDQTIATGTWDGSVQWRSDDEGIARPQRGEVRWHADRDLSTLALDMIGATVRQALYAIVFRYETRQWLSESRRRSL